MDDTVAMNNGEVVMLKLQAPASKTTVRALNLLKPLQGRLICHYVEMRPIQEGTEVFDN